MPAITIRPLAINDLVEIWNYIADDSEQRADNFIDLLDRKINMLAGLPDMGRVREELAEGLRSFSVGRYIIFYYSTPKGIEVVRVLNSARDLDIIFHEDY